MGWHSLARFDTYCYSRAWRVLARHGSDRLGTAQRGLARVGTAQPPSRRLPSPWGGRARPPLRGRPTGEERGGRWWRPWGGGCWRGWWCWRRPRWAASCCSTAPWTAAEVRGAGEQLGAGRGAWESGAVPPDLFQLRGFIFFKENSRGWPVRQGGWTSRLCVARALPPAEGIRPAVSACCPGASRAGLRGQAATAGAGGTSSPLPAARQGAGLSCSSSSWSQLPRLLTTPSQFQHVLLLFLYCVVLQGRLSSSSSWLHAEGGFQHFMLIYYHFHDLSLICCKSFTWHKAVISWFSVGLVHLLTGGFSEHLRPYRESKVPAIPLSVCFEHPSSSSIACIWLTPVQGSLENTQEKPEYSCDTIKKKKNQITLFEGSYNKELEQT